MSQSAKSSLKIGVINLWVFAMAKLRRRLFTSLNFAVVVALLGVLFIMVNWVASRRYARWDFTKQKLSVLSDQTRQVLKTLTEPVSVTVFYQPKHRLYELVRDVLKEYERLSPQLQVEYVDPEQDIARAKQLAQQFEIDDLNVVVFQSGSRHKHLSDTELADYDYSSMRFGAEPQVKAFKGEDAFTSVLINLTQAQSPLIWFTTGHGEKSVDSVEPTGLGELKRHLEQQNMTVKTATLLEQTEVPADVTLIVIAGPTHRFTEAELAMLQGYLERGGRLMALLDPLEDSGLDSVLERWGVTLGMDIVVDPARQLPFVSAANLFVTDYTQHPIVEKMKTLMTLFPLARSVRPADPLPEGLTVTRLALTSEAGWGETNTADSTFQFDEGSDLKGPVSIAVAAQRSQPVETRLVVLGDSEFAMDAQLTQIGNRDLFSGAIYWLIEEERLIGISPKPLESIKLSLPADTMRNLFWVSFLAMPLSIGMLGAVVWWLRRS